VAFQFEQVTSVIVGTFNIYVIRPDWLGTVGFVPKGSEMRIESQLNQPGFRLSSPSLGAKWVVLPNRLILETADPNEDCGATVDRILENLPWTPLMALGCNLVYRGDASAVDGWEPKTAFPSRQITGDFVLKQRTWHIGVQRGDQLFNLQMSDGEDGVEIRVNVHTDLHDRDITFARETARRFFPDRQIAVSLMRELFNARVDDGIQHS
jgi:hypothetical protein